MALTEQDIEQITRIFRDCGWDEMRLKVGSATLLLSTDPDNADNGVSSVRSDTAPAPVSTKSATTPAAALAPQPVDGLLVRAPNLGTFWRRPKPGAPPYIEIGAAVDEDSEVCLIEVMKLFTPIQAGCKGRVAEVLVEDGEMVEFDQPLFRLDPLG
jgi:acetyl-CoA carboxylase biotin carboxyl carrier protein